MPWQMEDLRPDELDMVVAVRDEIVMQAQKAKKARG